MSVISRSLFPADPHDIVVIGFIYPFLSCLPNLFLYFPLRLFGFALSHHLLYSYSYHIYYWSLPFVFRQTLICVVSVFSPDVAIRY